MSTGISPTFRRTAAPLQSISTLVTRREFAVLQLRINDDLTYEEIAASLSISRRTAFSDYHSALYRLRAAGSFVVDIDAMYAA